MSLSRSCKTIEMTKQLRWLLGMDYCTWNRYSDIRRHLFWYDGIITISQDNRSHKTNEMTFGNGLLYMKSLSRYQKTPIWIWCRYHDLARQSIPKDKWDDFWEWVILHEIVITIRKDHDFTWCRYHDLTRPSISRDNWAVEMTLENSLFHMTSLSRCQKTMISRNVVITISKDFWEFFILHDIVITMSKDNDFTQCRYHHLKRLLGILYFTWHRYHDVKRQWFRIMSLSPSQKTFGNSLFHMTSLSRCQKTMISRNVVITISKDDTADFGEWILVHYVGITISKDNCCTWCRYRVAKTHRMPYLYRSFSAKEPYN